RSDLRAIVPHPNLGAAFEDRQNLFHRVQVGRRTVARLAILVENAQLHRPGHRRNEHPGRNARPPVLALLRLMLDELHVPPSFWPPVARMAASLNASYRGG